MNFEDIIQVVKSVKKIVFSETLRECISMKGEADFVTEVDIQISDTIKKALSDLYPDVGFYSEEDYDKLEMRSWILDPIDGTTNLVYGYNMSTISLAYYENGEILFGVVYNPFTDECFTAEKNKGAFLNDKSICVRKREMPDSIIEFGAGSTRKHDADQNFEIAKDVFKNCLDIRRICSSALDLCLIAAGRIDGYFEKVLKPWDYAAGCLILKEAGGVITDYNGNPVPFDTPSSVIASNGIIHEELKSIINRH